MPSELDSQLEVQARYEATVLGSLRRQLTRPKPPPNDVQLSGAVGIITGGNGGLGLEASRQLLQLGLSHLVMGVRSQVVGDTAADALRMDFPRATISVWAVELESYDSVREFAGRCATLSRIDIAILNAATSPRPTFTTVASTGHELSLQVNYLSTALLAILLLPILKDQKKSSPAGKPPVLTIVGSDTAYETTLETEGPVLAQLDRPDLFEQFPAYRKTKLLNALFVARLADFVSPDDVLVNVVNPGLTSGTDLMRAMPLIPGMIMAVAKGLLARPLKVGVSVYIDAVVTQGRESHGRFVSDWTIKP